MSYQEVVSNEPGARSDEHPGAVVGQWTDPVPVPAPVPGKSAHAGTEVVLLVEDLAKTFRSGFLRRKQRGIAGVSFSVSRGSVFALLGHNGAGKTTTISCILDLVHADSGKVEIFGRNHREPSARAEIGYLPERPYFFEHLTGRELLEFYSGLLDVPAGLKRDRIESALEVTGMAGAADRRLRKYSKGMLQRIGLAQTLLGDPELLVLDEPMSGLDPIGRREVRELLLKLKARGKTIILSSHIVPDVEMLADSVGILREGKLVLTRNLDDGNEGTSYKVKLLDTGAGTRARVVTAQNVDALREVLDRCHADGIPVVGVEVRRSGLEDIFMAAHGAAEVTK